MSQQNNNNTTCKNETRELHLEKEEKIKIAEALVLTQTSSMANISDEHLSRLSGIFTDPNMTHTTITKKDSEKILECLKTSPSTTESVIKKIKSLF